VARIGAPAARDLLFSARRMPAEEALRIGLVDRVFESGTLNAELAAYIKLLAGNAPASIKVAKDFVARAVAGQSVEDAATRAAYLDILDSADFAEGKAAFKARRPPKFQ
jgi:enoyl-CoA hydratase/carnithine racemase